MYFSQPFRKLGELGPSISFKALDELPDTIWDELDMRQKQFEVHSSTRSIPLVFDEDNRHRLPTVHPLAERFKSELEAVMGILNQYFSQASPVLDRVGERKIQAYLIRAILVKLLSNSRIDPHNDFGYSLSRCHRIHIPIVTNDRVVFTVDGEEKHLERGQLWEINNRAMHAVRNESDQDRIHLIVDYVIPGEVIEDPFEGRLVA